MLLKIIMLLSKRCVEFSQGSEETIREGLGAIVATMHSNSPEMDLLLREKIMPVIQSRGLLARAFIPKVVVYFCCALHRVYFATPWSAAHTAIRAVLTSMANSNIDPALCKILLEAVSAVEWPAGDVAFRAAICLIWKKRAPELAVPISAALLGAPKSADVEATARELLLWASASQDPNAKEVFLRACRILGWQGAAIEDAATINALMAPLMTENASPRADMCCEGVALLAGQSHLAATFLAAKPLYLNAIVSHGSEVAARAINSIEAQLKRRVVANLAFRIKFERVLERGWR